MVSIELLYLISVLQTSVEIQYDLVLHFFSRTVSTDTHMYAFRFYFCTTYVI